MHSPVYFHISEINSNIQQGEREKNSQIQPSYFFYVLHSTILEPSVDHPPKHPGDPPLSTMTAILYAAYKKYNGAELLKQIMMCSIRIKEAARSNQCIRCWHPVVVV